MPPNVPRQQLSLLRQLLGIVLAEVELRLCASGLLLWLHEGQDVVRRLQLRDGYQPDLIVTFQHTFGSILGVIQNGEKKIISLSSIRLVKGAKGECVARQVTKVPLTLRPLPTAAIRSLTLLVCDVSAAALEGSIFISPASVIALPSRELLYEWLSARNGE